MMMYGVHAGPRALCVLGGHIDYGAGGQCSKATGFSVAQHIAETLELGNSEEMKRKMST